MIILKTNMEKIEINIHRHWHFNAWNWNWKNVYEDFSKNNEMSDFINYSADSKYYNQSNALAVGKIKDEMEGVVIGEFVGSKPKLYSVI